MHRLIQDGLEDVLAGKPGTELARQHLKECEECREGIAAMREQAALLRLLRAPAEAEPRPGFYARVMERIESQGAVSIWNLFFDSMFGRRIALASLVLALLMGAYIVSSEQMADPDPVIAGEPIEMMPEPMNPGPDQPGVVLTGAQDSVLVNLVTYQDQ